MRQLRFLIVIFTLALLLPTISTTRTIANASHTIDTQEPAAGLPRIYDLDITDEIYEQVDSDRIQTYVQEITSFGPRHVYIYNDIPGSENELARQWIVNKMTELSNGRIEIEILGDYMNIVGKLPGYLPGEHPVFIVSSHYDTYPLCPGANDNAVGVAVGLELLSIMSQYEWPLDIYFVSFNGAEAKYDVLTPPPGRLQGSEEVAAEFDNRNMDILAQFNVGAILREENHGPDNERVIFSYLDLGSSYYHVSQYWADLGKAISNWHGGDIVRTVSSSLFSQYFRSDLRKFVQRDFRSGVLAFETGFDDDDVYQSPDDVWYHYAYSYSIAREVTAVIGGCMAYTMSQSYGEDTHLDFDGVTYSGFATRYYFPVTMATSLNITARWFGSYATFILYSPTGSIINSATYTVTHPWNSTLLFFPSVSTPGLYTFEVWNTGTGPLGLDSFVEYDVDINGNGVPDKNEYWLASSLFSQDSDDDGISDAMEIIYGTNSASADSDDDNIPDNWEIENGLDPTNPLDALMDFDNDTLSNEQEYSYGLNPNSSDSDHDSLPDAWEVEYGLNPLVNDANEDPDGDNLTNLEEYLQGSNPMVAKVEEPPYLLIIGVPSIALLLVGIGVYLYRRE